MKKINNQYLKIPNLKSIIRWSLGHRQAMLLPIQWPLIWPGARLQSLAINLATFPLSPSLMSPPAQAAAATNMAASVPSAASGNANSSLASSASQLTPQSSSVYLYGNNGIELINPPYMASPDKPGRLTNQLLFLRRDVIRSLWKHDYAWPFQQPVDTKDFNIPVSFFIINILALTL